MYDPCPKTLFIGKKIVYLPTCHSTNDIAAELVRKENLPEGTVVITDAQTNGRGQRGARWLTTQGHNFTFSVVLRPTFLAASQQFLLSQAMALGVRRFVSDFTDKVRIKWPNDLYVNDLKIGGILIDNGWQGTRVTHAVVGIGLNINQTNFTDTVTLGLGESLLRATSLRLETGQIFSLRKQLPFLLQYLEQAYLRLRSGEYVQIRSEYQSVLVGYGERRLFRKNNHIFEAMVTGVTAAGKLCLQHTDGSHWEYDIKEIEWLWPDSPSSPGRP